MKSLLPALILLLAVHTPASAQYFGGSAQFGTTSTIPNSGFATMGSTAAQPPPGSSVGISPGTFYYYNRPGVGYYAPNPYASAFPAYVNPFTGYSNLMQFGSIGFRSGYWRAPSGYYYPWMPRVYSPGVTYGASVPAIVTVDQGRTKAARPPLSVVFNDMRQFLDESLANNKIDRATYDRLGLRLEDLQGKEKLFNAAAPRGLMSPEDDMDIRHQIDLVSLELARALKQ